MSQNALVVWGVALKVDAVVPARSSVADSRNIVGAGGGLNTLGDGDTNGGVKVHIGKDDVEGLGIGGDRGPFDGVVLAQVKGRAFGWGGDLQSKGRGHKGEEGRG